MNIVANSIGHHVNQSTRQGALKTEQGSLFASLFTKELLGTSKESLSKEEYLQKMMEHLEEASPSSFHNNIVRDETRVMLPIRLKDETSESTSLSDDTNQLHEDIFINNITHAYGGEQTTLGNIENELAPEILHETTNLFLQMIEQVLSIGEQEETSGETLLHMINTLEAYLQGNENNLIKMNEVDDMRRFQDLFSQLDISTEDLEKHMKLFESLLHKIVDASSGNDSLSIFIEKLVETLKSTFMEHRVEGSATSITNSSSMAIHAIHEESVEKNEHSFMHEFQRISKNAQQLIEDIIQNNQTSKTNKQLLQLLEKANILKQTFSEDSVEEMIEGNEETKNIWMNLQSMYEKRTSLNKNGNYFHNAKVRSSDVGLWVGGIAHEEAVAQVHPSIQLQQQMTPVEHFVLHARTQDDQVVQQEQMMHQLKRIIQQSSIGKNQFFKQISISIQPEQLGEMTIQLVKVDGEMIAKITVSSQATKNALDSNLHQLKNMFAPHQVLIEKQDGNEQATFDQDDKNEEHHQSSHENEKEQYEEETEQSFVEQFEQILEETVGES